MNSRESSNRYAIRWVMVLKNTDVVFSTDMYYPESIKTVERRRRGCAETLVLHGEMTKRPADGKALLTNNENNFS